MRLAVFSHKPCWSSAASPSGYATDGGFPFQMKALSELFEQTTLVVPCYSSGDAAGEIPLSGNGLIVRPVAPPRGRGLKRKLTLPFWFLTNSLVVTKEIVKADAVHTPIPGDIGTIGMVLALLLRKRLFVRHCGNWFVQKTAAEHFWKWFMERFAGGANVMLATGGAAEPPSRNKAIRWIFSTTLTEFELESCVREHKKSISSDIRLITACRLDPEKGTDIVIKSLPRILEDFPSATLDVVGDGPALNELKHLTESLGLTELVRFHGKVDHQSVLNLLQQADLFCYPTATEGFPKIVLEALACGLPVITSRVSVLPELIGSGCGLLLDERTPAAVAEAAKSIFSDPAGYESMCSRSFAVAKQYSIERWRDTIGELLRTAWLQQHTDA